MTPILPNANQRRPYRTPIGMPGGREDWRIGSAASVLVHLALLVLLLTPLAVADDIREIEQGSGGAGPAGGGGGQPAGGAGYRAEVLRFIRLSPAARPAPTPRPEPQIKPVDPPKPAPPLEKLPEPVPPPPVQQPASVATPSPGTTGVVSDSAGGTGGAGPGRGGGTGSGSGTGAGSATGPGRGGGRQANYPPTPIEMFIPPLPVPASVRGFHLIAEFDVDERGRVLGMTFTETKDRGYNRRLEDVLRGYRFRPGTRPDGTPIRMKAQITIDLP